MKATMLDPLLRTATIKAIDSVAKKFTSAERSAEKKATRLLAHWNRMDPVEKEEIVGIAVATITTAVTAIVALRRRAKSPLRTAGRKLVKAVKKKVG